jgi:hypothetical protein
LKDDPTLAARLDADPELQSVHADRLVRRTDARRFDLHYEYTSFAPESERWTCIDLNTYDGAPDSEAPCNFIGRGPSQKSARMDLLDQFAEHDGFVSSVKATVIHSSPFEPDDYGRERNHEEIEE